MTSTLKHIAKHSAIYAAADILAKLVGFLLLPLYSRKFSASEYGILALIQILNTLPSKFIAQGINTSSIKAITLDYADDPAKRRVALSTAHYYLILSAIVVNACLCLSIPWLSRYLIKSDQYNHLLLCTFATSLCETARMIPLNVLLRARFRSVLYSTMSFCEFLISVSLNVYFVVFRQSGIAGIVYTDLIVGFTGAVVAFFIIRPELVPVFSWAEVGRMVRFGWPLLPARMSMWLLDFADRFQLQKLSTAVELGLYAVGAKYARIFQFLFLVQFEKVWPSVYFPLSREKDAREQFARLFTYVFMAACGLGLGVVLFVEPVIRLTLTPSYWPASRVVVWLVGGFILEVTYQVFTAGLRVANQTRVLPAVVGIGAAANIVANIWVLPRWGMVGAGFTTFCGFGILVALGYHWSNRFYPVEYEWSRLGRVAALFTAAVVADRLLSLQDVWLSLPVKVALLAAFAVGLRVLGVVTAAEMGSLRATADKMSLGMRRALGLGRWSAASGKAD